MAGGRPSLYSAELATEICARLAGGESLRTICDDDGMPHRDTVHNWLLIHQEFADQYAQARERQADFYAEEIIAISDEAEVETKYEEESVTLVLNATAVARNRLRMDARKWYASKLAPKKYGDRQALDVNAKVESVSMTEDQAKRIAQEFLNGVSG